MTEEEYQQFVDAVEERLKGAEPVNLVLVLPDVKFYADQTQTAIYWACA